MSKETMTLITADEFVNTIFDSPGVLANYAVDGAVDLNSYFRKRGIKGTLTKGISFSRVQINGSLSLTGMSSEAGILLNEVTVTGQVNLSGLTCNTLHIEKCSFEEMVLADGLQADRFIVNQTSFKKRVLLNDVNSEKMTWQANNGEVFVNQPGVGLMIMLSKSNVILQHSTKDE